MDPPFPPPPTTIVGPNPPVTPISNAIVQLSYADSTSSSPCSNQTDNWDDSLPLVPGAKLRVMCSFGGHIIPRLHDKSLCYVGGETRIVVVDRNSSLSFVHDRLSRTLLNGHKFTMKYQLPNEELDSLISVTSDEDLENMIEEHDRIMLIEPAKPARIRLFLFLAKPETTASMGALLNDAKSETWFVDALNNSDLLNRGASDSAVIDDNLLDFHGMLKIDSSTNLEDQAEAINIADQEVHTESQDSPRDNVERVISDDDISDKSLPVSLRKPPLPLQPLQRKYTDPYSSPSSDSKQAGAYSLQSPDSVTSENSVTSAASITKRPDYQDPPTVTNQDNGVFTPETGDRGNISNPSSQIYYQQVHELAAVPCLQQNPQQQFHQAPAQYIQHSGISGTGLMQVPSYYPMYAAAPTTHHKDQHYPVYLMPINHTQQYNLPHQLCVADAIVASSIKPPNQSTIVETGGEVLRTVQGPTPTYVQQNQFQQQSYDVSHIQPQTQTISSETDAEVKRTVQAPTQTYVQVPPNQFQQQYYDVPQIQPQTQTIPSETDVEIRRTIQAPTTAYVQVPPNQFQQQYYDVSQIQPQTQTIPTERDSEVHGTAQAPTATYSQVPPNQFQQQYYDVSKIQPQTQIIPMETDGEVHRIVQGLTSTYVQVPPNQFQQQYYSVSHVHPHMQPITTGQAATTNSSYNYTYPPHDQLNYVQHPTPFPSQYQTIIPDAALLISHATSQLDSDNASHQIQNSHNQNKQLDSCPIA